MASETAPNPNVDLSDEVPLHPRLTTAAYREFLRDLPELLATHPLGFVAYSKDGTKLDIDDNAAALEARLETVDQIYHIFYIEPPGLPVAGPSC